MQLQKTVTMQETDLVLQGECQAPSARVAPSRHHQPIDKNIPIQGSVLLPPTRDHQYVVQMATGNLEAWHLEYWRRICGMLWLLWNRRFPSWIPRWRFPGAPTPCCIGRWAKQSC